MRRTVIFYKTIDGKCPVQEFLDSLSGKVAQKVLWTLSLLEDLEIVPSTYFKNLLERRIFGSAGFNMAQIYTEYSVSLIVIRWLC
jgi:hypothetical protein